MLRLLQFLLFGHIHKWETISETMVETDSGSTGMRVRLRCAKCGNWKKKDLI